MFRLEVKEGGGVKHEQAGVLRSGVGCLEAEA